MIHIPIVKSLQTIISSKFPLLHGFLPPLIFASLCAISMCYAYTVAREDSIISNRAAELMLNYA